MCSRDDDPSMHDEKLKAWKERRKLGLCNSKTPHDCAQEMADEIIDRVYERKWREGHRGELALVRD